MDEDFTWSYRRWRAADDAGSDDDADAAFKSVLHAVRAEPRVSPGFTERTMAAIAGAAGRDAVRARRTRAALVSGSIVGGAAAAYFGAGLAVSALSTGVLRLLDLMLAVVVGAAAGVDAGAGFWGMFASLGRAASALAADPKVTFGILTIQGIAIAALFALQRLLGSNGESYE